MRGQYEELACLFCDKGRIACWYIPSVWTEKRSITATFGSRKTRKKTRDIWMIKSGCNVCGKSQEEIEKKLKEENII